MNGSSTFKDLVELLISYINLLVPIVIALTFLFIAWKVIQAWVINGGSKDSVEEGKRVALIGVIALVFMFGIWGLLGILQSSLRLGTLMHNSLV